MLLLLEFRIMLVGSGNFVGLVMCNGGPHLTSLKSNVKTWRHIAGLIGTKHIVVIIWMNVIPTS